MAERTVVSALTESETRAFLERVELLAAYEEGSLRCSICEEALRDAGLGAARAGDEGLVFACLKLDCLEDFHRR